MDTAYAKRRHKVKLIRSLSLYFPYFPYFPIDLLSEALGKPAQIKQLPFDKADMEVTFAAISKAKAMLGYDPQTTMREGLAKFVKWFRDIERV